jgi:hypothetical protein
MIIPNTFANIKGISFMIKPYINQSKTPESVIRYIHKEISLVCFVLKLLISWGTAAKVVKHAASNPKNVIIAILFLI